MPTSYWFGERQKAKRKRSVDDKTRKQCEKYKCATKWLNVGMAPSQQYLLICITCYVQENAKKTCYVRRTRREKDEIVHGYEVFFLLRYDVLRLPFNF